MPITLPLGHLYVGGGGGESKGPWYRDLWRLSLKKPVVWQELPGYPAGESQKLTATWLQWHMTVYNDKAYLFTGQPDIDVFDLKTQKWGLVTSTFEPTAADIVAGVDPVRKWSYPVWTSQGATQQVVGDRLYVFGGTHGLTIMGCNLFMVLDLKTLRWRRLTGTLNVRRAADYACPGPRNASSSWVSGDKKRIYLIFGECDRSAASMHKEPHGSFYGYAYEDFWSWDVEKEEWRLERLVGNVPCPRSEAACTYVSLLFVPP